MLFFKSSAVAEQLGVPYYRLFELLRSRKIVPPQKDSSGDYYWLPDDVERAREALWKRRRCCK